MFPGLLAKLVSIKAGYGGLGTWLEGVEGGVSERLIGTGLLVFCHLAQSGDFTPVIFFHFSGVARSHKDVVLLLNRMMETKEYQPGKVQAECVGYLMKND